MNFFFLSSPSPPPPPLSLSLSLSLSYLQSIHVLPASLFTHFCSIYIVFFYIFPEYDIVNFHTGTKIDIQEGRGRLHTKQMANVVVGSSPGMHMSGMGEVFFFFFFFFFTGPLLYSHHCFLKKMFVNFHTFFYFYFYFYRLAKIKENLMMERKEIETRRRVLENIICPIRLHICLGLEQPLKFKHKHCQYHQSHHVFYVCVCFRARFMHSLLMCFLS